MAGRGEGFDVLQRTLTGYAEHPNFGGFLLLGLGCEVNQVAGLVVGWQLGPDKVVHTMNIQDEGGHGGDRAPRPGADPGDAAAARPGRAASPSRPASSSWA